MFFQRYYLDCLSHASYMIADEETKVAAIIDPQRDIDQYLEDATNHGLEIKHVILTHFHADFVAGHIELRDQLGARIYLGSKATAEFDFSALSDGDTIDLGSVRIVTMETPGHTPEGISLIVHDDQSSPAPYAVLTGDTLFLGDVGRPDLFASEGLEASELAEMLYDSLHNKLLTLPDDTLVYPAHGAGSMCGKQLSTEESSTLGNQRKYNYALQPMSREQFIDIVTADQPDAPAYFSHDAQLNRQDRASLDTSNAQALELEEVLNLQAAGAQLVDVRNSTDFASGHLRGSVNIGIDGKYATWCGTVLNKEQPIVIIGDPDRIDESIMRLGRIGFDHVAGFLKEGLSALRNHPELVRQTRRISARALSEAPSSATTIIDIRTPAEWNAGHIDNAVNIPLNQLCDRLSEIPTEGDLIVHCQGGYRSSLATSILQNAGREDAIDLVGGIKAWTTTGLPLNITEGTKPCSI